MSETSYFWSGTVTGDAANASYDHLEFTKVYNKFFASDGAGYVIPGYGNSLKVQASSPAAATIDVLSGAAMIQGFLYENTALNTFAISANASGNPRIDRVVLRINFASQTVRLAILTGTPAVAPALPTLTQSYGVTWEEALAYIWVANGFGTIADSEIHDEILFISTAYHANISRPENLILNSEFIAAPLWSSGDEEVAATWITESVSVPVAVTAVAKPAAQPRGHALSIQNNAGAANTLRQHIPVLPNTTYVVRGLINTPVAGAEIEIFDNTVGSTQVKKTIRRVSSYIDEQIVFTTGGSTTSISFIYRGVANQTVLFGQAILTKGYIRSPFMAFHEYIPFIKFPLDASWSATLKSSGATAVDLLSAAFGGLAACERGDIQALDMEVTGSDTGSAGGTASLVVQGPGNMPGPWLVLTGLSNAVARVARGIVTVKDQNGSVTYANARVRFVITVAATGVNTLTATVRILGMFT